MNVGKTTCATRTIGMRVALQALVMFSITVSVLSVVARGQLRAGAIDSISPAKARIGEVVTIQGHGFGALNVKVTVGGVTAQVLAANGNQVTFVVPRAAASGPTVVTATNPGGQSGRIDFTLLEGILLPGDPNALAVDALFNLPPVRVGQALIENGVITTRFDVRVTPAATVAQVNAALKNVSGGIVSMMQGIGAFTIAIPKQSTVDGLLAIAATLKGQPGIGFVELGREVRPTVLPGGNGTPSADEFDLIAHLLPARFPAAWNVADGLVNGSGCTQPKVPVIIPDFFGSMPSGFEEEIGGAFHFVSGSADASVVDADGNPEQHGYLVSEVMGASGLQTFTGANPFSACLDLGAVQTAGLTQEQEAMDIAGNFPSGKFIMSYSKGYNDDCIDLGQARDECIPPRDPTIALPLDRALDATLWKELTKSRWPDFLSAVSAGNSLDTDAPNIYRGTGDSRYANEMAIAQLPDTSFAFVEDPALWSPTSPAQVAAGFEPLFDPGDAAGIALVVQHDGLQAAREDSVLVVGGTTTIPGTSIVSNGAPPSAVSDAAFSKTGPDVKAVAENVFHCGSLSCSGNSLSAPQVAGLASYLWLLSPDLRHRPASATRQAIVANTWPGSGLIDAYSTVLSLDAASLPTPSASPIRLALLDVVRDTKFDENDVAEFLHHFSVDEDGNPVTEPIHPDYSRYDLNGDGFTGGTRPSRFDLDRVGSTQYGAGSYGSDVTQEIEGQTVHFNETQLTDLQVLCYYAYSAMYTGDTTARTNLLGQCVGTTVKVMPASPSVAVGGTQQFSAQVIGQQDPRVTWSVDGTTGGNSASGTITDAGLYTAPASPGSHTVRATSVADRTTFGEATVTVTAGSIAGVFLGTTQQNGNGPLVFQANISFLDGNGSPINSTSFQWPIGDIGGFMAQVNSLVAGVTRFSVYSISIGNTPGPVALTVNLSAPVGNLTVSGSTCNSTFTIGAGDVDALNIVPQCNSTATVNVHDVNGSAELAPDHSSVTLNAHSIGLGQGNIGALFIGCTFSFGCWTVQSSTVNVQATAVAQVSVSANNSSIKVSGQIEPWNVAFQCGINGSDPGCVPGVYLQGNNNTDLAAQLSGDVAFFLLDNNTWSASPRISIGDEIIARDVRTINLGLVSITNNRGLTLGDIDGLNQITGDLRITGNIGFDDNAANAFANGRSVQGGVAISQNSSN